MSFYYSTIRNYRPRDLDALIRLKQARLAEPAVYCTTLPELPESLGHPGREPEKDVLVTELDGSVAGYLEVVPEIAIGRAVLNCLLRAEDGSELAALVSCGLRRSGELGLRTVQVNIPEANVKTERIFTEMGFRQVRCFFEMRLNLSQAHPPERPRSEYNCRFLKAGEEEKLTELQNRSFISTWGYNPNTVEEVVYRTSLPRCSPGDVMVAWMGGLPVGYCWTRLDCGQVGSTGGSGGRIYMLGVDPRRRRSGVGKQVLLAGLAHLRSKRMKVAELTVDSANEPALKLYRRVGFELRAKSVWLEKELNP